MANIQFKTKAPFRINGAWVWITWLHPHGNMHKAMIEKGDALGATGWDYGQALHEFADRANF